MGDDISSGSVTDCRLRSDSDLRQYRAAPRQKSEQTQYKLMSSPINYPAYYSPNVHMAASQSTYLVFGMAVGCVNFEPLCDLSCCGNPYNLEYPSKFESIQITLSSFLSLSRSRTCFLHNQ
jgi:hypothetical protein